MPHLQDALAFAVASRLHMRPRLKYVFNEEAESYSFDEIVLSGGDHRSYNMSLMYICMLDFMSTRKLASATLSTQNPSCMIGITRRLGPQDALSFLADDDEFEDDYEWRPKTGYQLTSTSITFYSPVHHKGDTRPAVRHERHHSRPYFVAE
jgi:hypothetical protein